MRGKPWPSSAAGQAGKGPPPSASPPPPLRSRPVRRRRRKGPEAAALPSAGGCRGGEGPAERGGRRRRRRPGSGSGAGGRAGGARGCGPRLAPRRPDVGRGRLGLSPWLRRGGGAGDPLSLSPGSPRFPRLGSRLPSGGGGRTADWPCPALSGLGGGHTHTHGHTQGHTGTGCPRRRGGGRQVREAGLPRAAACRPGSRQQFSCFPPPPPPPAVSPGFAGVEPVDRRSCVCVRAGGGTEPLISLRIAGSP